MLGLVVVDDNDLDYIAKFRYLPRRGGSLGTKLHKLSARFLAQIIDRQVKARFGDINGNGFAHSAETDKTDFEWHNNLSSGQVIRTMRRVVAKHHTAIRLISFGYISA